MSCDGTSKENAPLTTHIFVDAQLLQTSLRETEAATNLQAIIISNSLASENQVNEVNQGICPPGKK